MEQFSGPPDANQRTTHCARGNRSLIRGERDSRNAFLMPADGGTRAFSIHGPEAQ